MFIFSIPFTWWSNTGKWYFHKQKYLLVRILSSFCNRYKHTYIRHRDLWTNRLYYDISNSTKKQCLTIDTRDIIDLGPAKFRTQADNNTEQICYYNRNKKDTSFNSFLAVRRETSSTREIIFSIVKVIDKTNGQNTIYYEISDELRDFKNDIVKCRGIVQRISKGDAFREASHDRSDWQQRSDYRQVSKKSRFISR